MRIQRTIVCMGASLALTMGVASAARQSVVYTHPAGQAMTCRVQGETLTLAREGETRGGEPQPGDDRGGKKGKQALTARERETGDDRGGQGEPQPGDDRGGKSGKPALTAREREPGEPQTGDDRGGKSGKPALTAREREAGDDRGGHGENEPGDDRRHKKGKPHAV